MIRLSLLVALSGLAAFAVLPILACTTVITDQAPPGLTGDGGTSDESSTDNDGGSGNPDGGSAGTDAGPFTMASHPPYPQMPRVGPGILSPMKLVTITASGDPNGADYGRFGTALVGSKWYAAIAKDYGLGTPTSVTPLVGAALSGPQSDTDMQNYIAATIAGTPAAQPNGNTMYILYLPPGVGESKDPTCQQYGGYHQAYGSGGDGWGFVQHCANPPGLSQIQWMTTAASHEIIEAATDTGQGWAFGPSGPSETVWATLLSEVGDLCVGTQLGEGLYTYQRVWMNSLAAGTGDPCGPASTKVYYNTAAQAGAGGLGWFPVTAGAKATLPVTGFSTARMPDWILAAQVTKASCPGGCAATDFTITITSPNTTTIGGKSYPVMNNGVVGTLTVSAKASVASGSFAEIQIVSEGPPMPGADPYHVWPVGVYVP